MPRHQQPVDRGRRTLRLALVALVWLAGLVAGFYALLGVAVRYGCSATDDGLACHDGGTVVGSLLAVTVVSVVTAVTVLAATRSPRAVAALAVAGLLALGACLIASRLLLQTV